MTFDDWMQSSRGEPFRDFSPSGIYSTNAVATVRRGQHKLVHKAYLLAHRSNREHDLGRSRCNMGAILGRYCYVERLTGSVHLLGTLRAYVEGATLDVPLRESFRHCVCSPSTSHVATEYEQSLMKQVAVGLLKLQREISESEPHGTSSITRILADATRRCEDLAKLVEADPELTLPLRHRVIAAMRAMIQPPAPEQSCIDPGGMHGDLHFGHIILSKHGVHFIDFENFDIAADGVSTPWKDVVSLARAFEYFSHDEVCRVAVRLGNDEHSIAKRLVAEWPRLPVQLLDLIQRSRSWRLAIWQVFIGAYGAHSASVPNPKCLRLLYVQRLLQELQYNYAHSRSFYKWFDLYYILQNTMGEPCTL